jgi:hypothetical protein
VTPGEEDVVVVSFDVEANGLGEAVTQGERQLDDALKAPGVEMRYWQPARPAGPTRSVYRRP